MCFSSPGHSSYGLEVNMAMCSSWAHPWALSRLLGPVTSLGSSLNNRHSPWASGQLGKAPGPWPGWYQLVSGWGRLDKASGPEQAWIGWYNTLTHTEHSFSRNFVG